MSRIFEALRRSEAERSAIDLLASEATELRRAERSTPSKWEIALLAQTKAQRVEDRDASFGFPRKSLTGSATAVAEYSQADLAQTKTPRVEDRDASFDFPGKSILTGGATAVDEYSQADLEQTKAPKVEDASFDFPGKSVLTGPAIAVDEYSQTDLEQTKAPKVEDESFGFPGKSVLTGPATAVAEYSQAEEHLDPFAQFQSLQVSLGPQSRLVCLTESGSPAAEAFRLLGVRLRHLRRDRSLKTVLITSTIPHEGKSMLAGNLACTLALKTQQRTLLLEGDLRRPALSQIFGLGRNPGLAEWLNGAGDLTTSIYRLEDANLWILPAGSTPSNALVLLQSGRLSKVMDQLTALFDWIIIDSPPVLPLADTSIWMRLADGILLATRQGTTEKRHLQRGLEVLETKKLLGALVNSSQNASASDYYYNPTTI